MEDATKKRIRVRLDYLYDLYGTFDEVIERLRRQRAQVIKNYPDATDIRIEEIEFCNECSGVVYGVMGDRNQTAFEQKRRQERESVVEAVERAEYERLKAKFEGGAKP